MNIRLISDSEINQRHQDVRSGAHYARHSFTISGMRQLIGNTLIALGMHMHGRSEKCRESLVAKPTVVPAHSL